MVQVLFRSVVYRGSIFGLEFELFLCSSFLLASVLPQGRAEGDSDRVPLAHARAWTRTSSCRPQRQQLAAGRSTPTQQPDQAVAGGSPGSIASRPASTFGPASGDDPPRGGAAPVQAKAGQRARCLTAPAGPAERQQQHLPGTATAHQRRVQVLAHLFVAGRAGTAFLQSFRKYLYEGVEHAVASVHHCSQDTELLNHCLVCDAPPLCLLNSKTKRQQHPL
uniref:Uncharacterized protein n=1 Tax=Setaria viridis TaxID=4556 RepID=A0A4U6VPU2_SETVI|nr:uncharacterized protein LOC117845763 [Setaria viridis]TKW30764.1 hypothetical protein SEVIR_2G059500v2 [Setaria viridis]